MSGDPHHQLVASSHRSREKHRSLTAKDLGLQLPSEEEAASPDDEIESPGEEIAPSLLPESEVGEDDERYKRVLDVLASDYAGVIFSGPPGTSKSWYAEHIGVRLAERDPNRLRLIQFHPSYQYEDFVEGYVPRRDGDGFRMVKKHFLRMCDIAKKTTRGEEVRSGD